MINYFPMQDFHLNLLTLSPPSGLSLDVTTLEKTWLMNQQVLLDIYAMIYLEWLVPQSKQETDCLTKILSFFSIFLNCLP